MGDPVVEREQRGVTAPGRRREQGRRVDLLADHRGELERLPLGLGQPRQPALQRVTDGGGRLPPGVVERRQAAAGRQVPPQLAEEEGVAAGLVPQEGRRTAGLVRRHPALGAQVVDDVLGPQALQVDPSYAVQALEPGERGDERR